MAPSPIKGKKILAVPEYSRDIDQLGKIKWSPDHLIPLEGLNNNNVEISHDIRFQIMWTNITSLQKNKKNKMDSFLCYP